MTKLKEQNEKAKETLSESLPEKRIRDFCTPHTKEVAHPIELTEPQKEIAGNLKTLDASMQMVYELGMRGNIAKLFDIVKKL